MVVEIKLNGIKFEPSYFTPLKKSFDINEKIVFPMRYCDLAIKSLVGITIYDMRRPIDTSIVASTTIDLFDEKLRLRQGTFNLFLWPASEADINIPSKTPGLYKENESLTKINTLLQSIDFY
jgi:hypothetical protein